MYDSTISRLSSAEMIALSDWWRSRNAENSRSVTANLLLMTGRTRKIFHLSGLIERITLLRSSERFRALTTVLIFRLISGLPDWRARLLEWVELQLNLNRVDTSFSAQAIGAWLDKFDPLSVWFRTTSDLMQLCRVAHLESEKRLPNPGDANAGHRLTELLFARGGIQANAYKVKQLSEARWARMDVTWDDVLSLSTWLELSGPGAALVSREELDEIVTAKNIGDREKAADRVAALLEAGNPEALLRSGLLIERQRGCFDFRHRSTASLMPLKQPDRVQRVVCGIPLLLRRTRFRKTLLLAINIIFHTSHSTIRQCVSGCWRILVLPRRSWG